MTMTLYPVQKKDWDVFQKLQDIQMQLRNMRKGCPKLVNFIVRCEIGFTVCNASQEVPAEELQPLIDDCNWLIEKNRGALALGMDPTFINIDRWEKLDADICATWARHTSLPEYVDDE